MAAVELFLPSEAVQSAIILAVVGAVVSAIASVCIFPSQVGAVFICVVALLAPVLVFEHTAEVDVLDFGFGAALAAIAVLAWRESKKRSEGANRQPVAMSDRELITLILLSNLPRGSATAAAAGPRGKAKAKQYDSALKLLADEQGDWYVDLVIQRELRKLFAHHEKYDRHVLANPECECGDDCPDDCNCDCHVDEDECECGDVCPDDCDCDCHLDEDCGCNDDCPDDCDCDCHEPCSVCGEDCPDDCNCECHCACDKDCPDKCHCACHHSSTAAKPKKGARPKDEAKPEDETEPEAEDLGAGSEAKATKTEA